MSSKKHEQENNVYDNYEDNQYVTIKSNTTFRLIISSRLTLKTATKPEVRSTWEGRVSFEERVMKQSL